MRNKFLLAYCLTTSANFLLRMRRSCEIQDSIDKKMGANIAFATVLISDFGHLPNETAAAFGDVCRIDPFVVDQKTQKSYFCLSKFRNASIKYALDHGYEWMMLCDCDTAIIKKDFDLPPSLFSVPNVYWQKRANESAEESLNAISSSTSPFSAGNSWFILNHAILERFRFNENIYGYGAEDREFDVRARAGGYRLGKTSLTVIHSFHETREKVKDPYTDSRNRRLLDATRTLLTMRRSLPITPRLEVVNGVHPNWRSALILLVDEKVIVHVTHKSTGKYEMIGDKCYVSWDKFGRETFTLRGEDLVSDKISEEIRE